ncbi:hypothetical protein QYF61_016798 [Mycteria americana]|uniref:Uncharacterized protein n=1 Tax=Mycteria americana TaxID=33587 RepID=A0AAN7NVR5_MYCAM|nr:hypothetical protein QYF61_016798 [Mycteria americana]
MGRDIFNQIRLLRAPSNLTLNVSRDGASTTSLGNLGQCLTTLSAPFKYWKAAIRSPRSLLFSRLNNPNSPSLSPQQRCSSPRIIFVASSGPAPTAPCPSCAEDPRAGRSTAGGSHQSGAEGQNPLPRPAGHAALDAAQDTVGFLGCECTLSAHVQLFIHQYPQVLLRRAALHPFIPQPVLIPGVALTQGQDPALGLVEPHEVHVGPLLKLVQVPLDGILSLRRVSCTTQLGAICNLAEGALDPTVYVIDEDTKQSWSQYGPLRDTTHH